MLLVIHKINQFDLAKNQVIESFHANYLFSKQIKEMFCSYFEVKEDFNKTKFLEFRNKIQEYKMDTLFVEKLIDSYQKSLFCFDMDSTLIKEEVIDELARKKNVYEEVAKITKEAMEGGLDFDSALRKRVSLLNDLDSSVFDFIFQNLHTNEGVEDLLLELPKKNSEIAIFSGGFIPVIEKFSQVYGIKHFKANELEFKDGKTTGVILGEIINKTKKKDYLLKFQSSLGVLHHNTIAIGDGANDSEMLNASAIGIGFHAKTGLKKEIINWIDFNPMTCLLFLFDAKI
jgi:phosphoserine phosphatase